MAKGRVGGTKSKVRGQVGDTIYQIRKNEDGTYTQIVMEKGERTETETSELLQAQRMCTAMVQACMRDLKEVGQISIQGAKTKTESLNSLSSLNLKAVRQDCINHWYDNGIFYFPYMTNKGTLQEQVGGHYILSQGTLDRDVFDSAIFDDEPYNDFDGGFTIHDYYYALLFETAGGSQTVGEFLKEHRMTRKDSICLAIFHEWGYEIEGEEEWGHQTAQDWIIAKINPDVKDSDYLSSDVLRNILVWESSNEAVTQCPKRNGRGFAIGFKIDWNSFDDTVYFMGAFSVSYFSGKKLIKSAQMHDPEQSSEQYLRGARPTNVFYSWMRAPRNPQWPSPFEQR